MNIRESAYSERRTKSGARCVSNKTVRKYKHKLQFSHTISDKNSELFALSSGKDKKREDARLRRVLPRNVQ